MKKFQFQLLLTLLACFTISISINAQSSLKSIDGRWVLMESGRAFKIKGVTFGYDNDVNNFGQHLKHLRSIGVNTIRTWAVGENTRTLLDSAHSYGIKVMLGIWMRHGRPGMEADDSFNYLDNNSGMEQMYNDALQAVKKFKDHPAVLTWAVGNEVYLNMDTDEEKKAYSLLLNKICSGIKKLDPYHPITSVEAWTFGLDWWQELVPSIDIYGINCYGAGANLLPEEFEKRGIEKPYIITEFGVTGEWDSPVDKNDMVIEPTDQQKYDVIANGYHEWIDNKSMCLGVYFFHYSDGDQHIAPWLFSHYKGMIRPQYWAIREAYTGKAPINNTPIIETFILPEGETPSDSWVPVKLEISDLENERLTVSFNYNQRTGSRKRRDQIVPLSHRGNINDGFEILIPKEHGAIKVYVDAVDTYNNVGIASTSILVIDEVAKERKFLVAKAGLPFYVYEDGSNMPYIPSGHMGNIEAIEVDLKNTDNVYRGTASLSISYSATDNWYGVGFVDPPNDWGDQLGGFDLSGAKKFSFWAKADDNNVKAKIGFGLIDADKPFPDTAKKSIDIVLTTKWKQYSINTKKTDLSCIRSGLVIFSSSTGFRHKIYLDDVLFE
ncbi:MAG: hypothetical protein JXQ96_21910 [Cyclobacteriaceae bacterium]